MEIYNRHDVVLLVMPYY